MLKNSVFLFLSKIIDSFGPKPSEFPPKIRIFGPPNFEKRFIKNPGGTLIGQADDEFGQWRRVIRIDDDF